MAGLIVIAYIRIRLVRPLWIGGVVLDVPRREGRWTVPLLVPGDVKIAEGVLTPDGVYLDIKDRVDEVLFEQPGNSAVAIARGIRRVILIMSAFHWSVALDKVEVQVATSGSRIFISQV